MDFGAKLPGFESWLTWRNYAQFPPQCCRDDSSTLVIKTFDIIEMEGNYDENWLREYIDTTIQTFTNEKLDVSRLTPEELKSWVNLNYQILPKKIYQDLYRATQNMRHLSKQQARAYVLNHLKPNGFYYEVHRSSQYYEKPIQL